MSTLSTSAFELPERLAAKADPALIADDERHFAAIAESLARSTAEVTARLDAARRAPVGEGQAAVERDAEIHRLAGELRALRRHGLDLCLGHVVDADGEATYIGRLGLLDRTGTPLLLDWRSPAAEPFFGATHADPMGLARRRRYRWGSAAAGGTTGGAKVKDYWDEVFTQEGLDQDAALDDQSAFIASLGANRSARMRDVLGTIAADQDAIIRAGSRGPLVVDGGPGTGKTVVALHRVAYLLYAEPRLRHGVLFVGPHEPYLAYVEDVLPSLGEEGVRLCTPRELVREGRAGTFPEPDPEVARLKSSARFEEVIEAAVRFYETPPVEGMTVETDFSDIWLSPQDWAEAFAAPEPGTPHNEAREEVWELLLEILLDKASGAAHDGSAAAGRLRASLLRNEELRAALDNAWTLIEAADLVGDLWSVPAYLRACAPWLSADEVRRLQRAEPRAWTEADLPLLDAARQRLGDPLAALRRSRHSAAVAAEREQRARVIDDLIAAAAHDDGDGLLTQLRQPDLQELLVDAAALGGDHADPLAGPFAHIVVDEAQELTDAQWQMLVRRCPSRSFTIVGDRAQARRGFTESWAERLERLGVGGVSAGPTLHVASLTINYRTPAEIMAAAAPVIRAVLPDANVPTSIRHSGIPVARGSVADLDAVLADWLAENDEGIACVISADGSNSGGAMGGGATGDDAMGADPRVRALTPALAKGLEFDLVVLMDPESFGQEGRGGVLAGAVDRYVAMTRATRRLVILTGGREGDGRAGLAGDGRGD